MELIIKQRGYSLLVNAVKLESGRFGITFFTGVSNFEIRLEMDNAKKLVQYLNERFKKYDKK